MKTRTQQLFAYPSSQKGAYWQQKAIQWAIGFSHLHFFTHNNYAENYPYGGFQTLLAAGAETIVPLRKGQIFKDLYDFHASRKDWLIGYLGYDLKNETEKLYSHHPNCTGFPDALFYVPQHLIWFREDGLEIASLDDPEAVFQAIVQTDVPVPVTPLFEGNMQTRTTQETYLQTVQKLHEHILDGDVYEINYCVEFFAENAKLQPLQAFQQLMQLSPMPFSVFGKNENQYLLCASPERFLKKTDNRLISMPIKGTIRRGQTPEEDARQKDYLRHSEKERAENMMIVDLVRNDLARSSMPGSVQVEEMFGIYSFATLHQMISTVTAQLRPSCTWTDAIRHAFPMGSMTGAPKIKSMELIEQYEDARRGLYSGTVGYVTPAGDFDLNVVIRSILYNADTQYLSFSVGSAITYDSVPEQEYAECLLKAQTMQRALRHF